MSHRAKGDYEYEKDILGSEVLGNDQLGEMVSSLPDKPDLKLSEAIKRYAKCQVADGAWSEDSDNDIQSTLGNFLDVVGDVSLRQIDRAKMRYFKDTFSKLPPYRNTKNIYKDKSVAEILKMDFDATVSPTTVKNNLRNANSFLNWCLNEGLIDSHPGHGLKVKNDKPPSDFRDPFSKKDIEAMFCSDRYVKDRFRVAFTFWCPILALYTGARREEVSQLHVDDLICEDGVWALSINKNPNSKGIIDKKVKNNNAIRNIPLHSFLTDCLNFPGYVDMIRSQGHERVFYDLTKTKKKNKYGVKVGKHFNTFKKTIILEPGVGKKDFHSFRHSFSHFFKMKKMQDDLFRQVFGHEQKSLAAQIYGGVFPVKMCYNDLISKLDYGVDLSHLSKSKWIVKK